MKSKTPERKRPEANTKVMLLWNFGKLGGFFRVSEHMSVEVDIMRRPIAALVLTVGLAMATVAPPSQAQAQGRDWGWGVVGRGRSYSKFNPGLPRLLRLRLSGLWVRLSQIWFGLWLWLWTGLRGQLRLSG
jgi:hypothetical protein